MTGRDPGSPEREGWIEVVVDANAADLLGRVLLVLWEGAAKVPATDLDARLWCFGIARNVLREHHRHTVKQLTLADELRGHLRAAAAHETAADVAAETNMRASEIRAAVAALDSRSRELIMLVHWDGFSIAEAARLLSLNEVHCANPPRPSAAAPGGSPARRARRSACRAPALGRGGGLPRSTTVKACGAPSSPASRGRTVCTWPSSS